MRRSVGPYVFSTFEKNARKSFIRPILSMNVLGRIIGRWALFISSANTYVKKCSHIAAAASIVAGLPEIKLEREVDVTLPPRPSRKGGNYDERKHIGE